MATVTKYEHTCGSVSSETSHYNTEEADFKDGSDMQLTFLSIHAGCEFLNFKFKWTSGWKVNVKLKEEYDSKNEKNCLLSISR